jgi:hypothetical protein
MQWRDAAKISTRGVAERTDTIDGVETLYNRWLDGVPYCYPEGSPAQRRRCLAMEVDGHDDWEPVPP